MEKSGGQGGRRGGTGTGVAEGLGGVVSKTLHDGKTLKLACVRVCNVLSVCSLTCCAMPA